MKLKKIFLSSLIALTVFGLTACGGGETSEQTDGGSATEPAQQTDQGQTTEPAKEENTSSNGETLIYAISGEPMSINPITTGDRWGLTIVNMVYSPLGRIEADGEFKLELAEDVKTSEDGMQITVKLREDAKFSDGEAVTADDVVFTYTTKADPVNGKSNQFTIDGQPIEVEKVDEYTVNFNLPSPSAAALNNIVFENYIMPEHIYKDQADYSVNSYEGIDPVGSGPYKMVQYNPGQDFRFEANENYYGGQAGIKNIVLQVIENAQTAKTALQSGEVDAYMVQPADVSDLDEEKINISTFSENRVGYIGLIGNSENLQNKDFRKAIFYALDRNEINKASYLSEEYYENAYSILPPNNPFYFDGVEKYETDLDKSKTHLDAAGVNPQISIAYDGSNPVDQVIATLAQEQLRKAGISLELKPMDSGAMYAELQGDGPISFDMFIGGYIMGNDPAAYAPLFITDGDYGYYKYSNPEVDELFSQGEKEIDPEARKEIYNEIQSIIADDAIFYPLVDNKKLFATNVRVGGLDEAKFVPIYQLEDMSKLTLQ